MSLHTYHEFDRDGKHYQFVHDELHETVGSYGYETEAETKAAEDEEIQKLESGEWVVLGCIVTEPCEGLEGPGAENIPDERKHHCSTCSGTVEVDSLWGIVIKNDPKDAEQFAVDGF